MQQTAPPVGRGETLLEAGVVLAIIPAAGDRPAQATVRLEAGDHCEGCPASVMCRPGDGDRRLMDVLDPIGVTVGDRVQVAVPGGAVLRASFLVYGLPLLLLLAGVGLGALVLPHEQPLRDLWSFFIGVALAAAAVPWVIRTVRRIESGGGHVLPARIDAKLEALEAGSGD
jgi:sigma-E factor negative regulatory protein RseC